MPKTKKKPAASKSKKPVVSNKKATLPKVKASSKPTAKLKAKPSKGKPAKASGKSQAKGPSKLQLKAAAKKAKLDELKKIQKAKKEAEVKAAKAAKEAAKVAAKLAAKAASAKAAIDEKERKRSEKEAAKEAAKAAKEAEKLAAKAAKTKAKADAKAGPKPSGEEEDFDDFEEIEAETYGDAIRLTAADLEDPEDVFLADAEGRRYCKVKDCDQLSVVEGFCRFHYLALWKKIQTRKKILSDGKLEKYIEELTSRYPDKYIEMIKRDLKTEKDFISAIQELEIDDSPEGDFEDDASFIEEVRGISSPRGGGESGGTGGGDESF